MKIVLFGATGPTGIHTLKLALDKGHEVTAIVRSPEKLQDIKHHNLQVFVGNARDKTTFEDTLQGKDAVISCLGSHADRFTTVTLYSKTIMQIHQAMQKHGIRRGLFMSCWGTRPSENQGWIMRAILTILVKNRLDDMARMEDYLLYHAKDIDYTIVRMPGLSMDASTNAEFMVANNDYLVRDGTTCMSRVDAARFLVRGVETDEYNQKIIAISVRPKEQQIQEKVKK